MIVLLVAASSVVARAGLKAMLEEVPECVVAGSVNPADALERAIELHPDAIVLQLAQDQAKHDDAAAALLALDDLPVVVITDRPPSEMIRAGARGVLPFDASAEQISAAVHAAVLNLIVTMAPARTPPERVSTALSPREREVLRMIGDGMANKEIAYRLGISEHTVKFHVSALLGKLGASTRAEAIRKGIGQGAILV